LGRCKHGPYLRVGSPRVATVRAARINKAPLRAFFSRPNAPQRAPSISSIRPSTKTWFHPGEPDTPRAGPGGKKIPVQVVPQQYLLERSPAPHTHGAETLTTANDKKAIFPFWATVPPRPDPKKFARRQYVLSNTWEKQSGNKGGQHPIRFFSIPPPMSETPAGGGPEFSKQAIPATLRQIRGTNWQSFRPRVFWGKPPDAPFETFREGP